MIVLDDITKFKSRDLVSLQCEACPATFYKEKHYIQKALKNKNYSLNTCSPECKRQKQSKVISANCWFCGKLYSRTFKDIGFYCSTACSKHMLDLKANLHYKVKHTIQKPRYLNRHCFVCSNRLCKSNTSHLCKTCYVLSDKAMEQRGRTFSKHRKYKTHPITKEQFYLMSSFEEKFFDLSVQNNLLIKKPPTLPWTDINNKPHVYFPDFYVPSQKLFIEIKGYLTKEDKIKLQRVQQQNPEIQLALLFKNDIPKFFSGLTTEA